MAVQLGSGKFTFEVDEAWAKLPDDVVLGDVAAVGIDRRDNVYAFNRSDHPMIVFDRDGNVLRRWGEGVFTRPHGIAVDSRGNIFVGELSARAWPRFSNKPPPRRIRTLHKLAKLPA